MSNDEMMQHFRDPDDVYQEFLQSIYDAAGFGIEFLENSKDPQKTLREVHQIFEDIRSTLTNRSRPLPASACTDCGKKYKLGTQAYHDCISNNC